MTVEDDLALYALTVANSIRQGASLKSIAHGGRHETVYQQALDGHSMAFTVLDIDGDMLTLFPYETSILALEVPDLADLLSMMDQDLRHGSATSCLVLELPRRHLKRLEDCAACHSLPFVWVVPDGYIREEF